MALHISPELINRFSEFYPFALDGTVPAEPVLKLEQMDNDRLADAVRGRLDAVCVIVRDSPQLQSLAPLAMLPDLLWVGVWNCPNLCELWQMSATSAVRGIAFTSCKRMTDLAALAGAQSLEHLMMENRPWENVQLQSLMPLRGLSNIRTLDLGCRKVREKEKLDFHAAFPQLVSLTITPGLRKSFISRGDKK